VAQFSSLGKQVNLDVYMSQTATTAPPTQYIASGQSFSNGDVTGVNAASCKLAGWH
jgi:hypothetical protein